MLPAVTELIPHRPPFLMIDEVVSFAPEVLVARRTWGAGEPFYAGHYPGNPITPGVLLCESVFQAAAAFLALRGGDFAGLTPVLSRIQDAKFKRMVRPGEVVEIEVRPKETLRGFHFMVGVVRSLGKVVLRVEFALAAVGDGSPGEG